MVGRLAARASVKNKTPCDFEFAPSDGSAEPVLARADAETPLPKGLAGATLRLRRVGLDWSETTAFGTGGGAGKRSKKLARSAAGSSEAFAVLGIETNARTGASTVALHPPIVLENRLPCGVLLTVQANRREGRCRAAPGAKGMCCDVDRPEWENLGFSASFENDDAGVFAESSRNIHGISARHPQRRRDSSRRNS